METFFFTLYISVIFFFFIYSTAVKLFLEEIYYFNFKPFSMLIYSFKYTFASKFRSICGRLYLSLYIDYIYMKFYVIVFTIYGFYFSCLCTCVQKYNSLSFLNMNCHTFCGSIRFSSAFFIPLVILYCRIIYIMNDDKYYTRW